MSTLENRVDTSHEVATHAQEIQGGVMHDDPRWKPWVKIAQQDATAPASVFPLIRVLNGAPHGDDLYNLSVELYRSEPRDYPPRHPGTAGAGLNLNLDSATALRDALTAWIDDQKDKNDG